MLKGLRDFLTRIRRTLPNEGFRVLLAHACEIVVSMLKGVRGVTDHVRAIVVSLAIVLLIGIGAYGVVWETFIRKVEFEVEPIEVPPQLADKGFTPRVAAQHLIEEVHEIHRVANTTMKRSVMVANWSQPEVVLLASGLSIQATAAYLRRLSSDSLFGYRTNVKRTKIVSGELLRGPGRGLSLRLRIDGQSVANVYQKVAVDQLFEEGAREIVRAIEPFILASFYYEKKDYVEVEELISLILAERPGTESEIRAVNLQGILLHDKKKFDEAIEKYQKAIERGPRFAPAYINWGNTLSHQRDYDGAIEKYVMATEFDPENHLAYMNWGVALSGKRDYDGASAKYMKAIELAPKNALAYMNWGIALSGKRDYDGAVEKYMKAIELDPNNALVYLNWGDALSGKNDCVGAIEKYETAIDLEPEKFDFLTDMIELLYCFGFSGHESK